MRERAKKLISAVLAVIVAAFMLAACAPKDTSVRVMLEDGAHFSVVGSHVKNVEKGGDVSFDIAIDEGCYYVSNNCGAEYESGVVTLKNVRTPQTVVLSVALSRLTVKLNGAAGMSIKDENGEIFDSLVKEVDYGSDAKFEVVIDEDYEYMGATVMTAEGEKTAAMEDGLLILYDVRADAEIIVQLRSNTPAAGDYVTVTLADGIGFTVSGETKKTVRKGETVTFEVAPEDGYEYKFNNCGAQYKDGVVTLTNVLADQEIVLTFRRENTDVTSYTGGDRVVYVADGTVHYTAEPRRGYLFSRWLDGDNKLYSYALDLDIDAAHVPVSLVPEFIAERDCIKTVTYHANGGAVYNSPDTSVRYVFSSPAYYYPATLGEWCYKTFYRDGYIAVEYNTEPDGSGTAYSTGSRLFDDRDGIDLYVMWRAFTHAGNFEYEYVLEKGENVGVRLLKYNGTDKDVVIPRVISGLPVIEIESNCFDSSAIKSVVISENIKRIEPYAFKNCAELKTVYMCDSVEYVQDSSFDGCFELSELRMMALLPPVHTDNLISGIIRRFEVLYKNRDDGKVNIVTYGGSGAFHSLDGPLIGRTLNQDKYRFINGGQNAYVSGPLMFDLYSAFMKKRDILITMPELSDTLFSNRLEMPSWIVLEVFYDAFRYIDLRDYSRIFTSFNDFQHGTYSYAFIGKLIMAEEHPCTYEDYYGYYDEYFTRAPDFEVVKAGSYPKRDVNYNFFRTAVVDVYNRWYREKLLPRGITTYYASFALYSGSFDTNALINYEAWLKENLAYKYISDWSKHIFDEEYISDSAVHLTREGAALNTKALLDELSVQMFRDGYRQ